MLRTDSSSRNQMITLPSSSTDFSPPGSVLREMKNCSAKLLPVSWAAAGRATSRIGSSRRTQAWAGGLFI